MKRMKYLITLAIFVAFPLSFCLALGEQQESTDSLKPVVAETVTDSSQMDSSMVDSVSEVAEMTVITYFHGNRRCATCRKLESYAEEAIDSAFGEQLKNGIMVWQTINYDEEENKHFIEKYQLYTKALILSRERNGKQVEWTNLDKIWDLVGNRDEYIRYVQKEVQEFLNPESE